MPGFELRRLSPAVGAEALGVDLSRPLSDSLVADLRAAWLDAGVLFFRDQNLTSDQFLALAHRFGEVSDYPFLKGLPGHPQLTAVVKLPHETVNFGGVWHTDTAYLPAPPMATLLIAREVPPAGGDTLFASQVAAYEALTAEMKARLAPLRAVNTSAKAEVTRTREDRMAEAERPGHATAYECVHPVVRTHPETGRKALYVNAAHTVRFDGMTEAESAPLLEFLFRHQTAEAFCCRFVWAPGSIALWDNRSVQHFPVNDYHGHRREMHRITLAGDVPR
jgi:taurine dioxygenase